MRKIRLVLLGVLCAGLLVCGIGTGVTLAEVSTFSYGGQQLLESAQNRTQSLTVTLDLPESTVYPVSYTHLDPFIDHIDQSVNIIGHQVSSFLISVICCTRGIIDAGR